MQGVSVFSAHTAQHRWQTAWQDCHPRGSSAAGALVQFTPGNYFWLMQALICMCYAGSVESQGLSAACSRLPVQVAALCTERETSSRRDDPLGQAWEAWVLLLPQKGDSSLTDTAEVFLPWLESWSAAHGCSCVILHMSEHFSDEKINPLFSLRTFDRERCLGFISLLQGRGSTPNSSFPLFSIIFPFMTWAALWDMQMLAGKSMIQISSVLLKTYICLCKICWLLLLWCFQNVPFLSVAAQSMVKWAGYGFIVLLTLFFYKASFLWMQILVSAISFGLLNPFNFFLALQPVVIFLGSLFESFPEWKVTDSVGDTF